MLFVDFEALLLRNAFEAILPTRLEVFSFLGMILVLKMGVRVYRPTLQPT